MNPLTAKDIMTQKVWVAQADFPVNWLAGFLVDKGISGAPVVSEDGRLLGAVSLTDIARHASLPVQDPRTHTAFTSELAESYAKSEISALRIKIDDEAKVIDIMTPVIFDVKEDTPIQDIADMMLTGRIRRVFVTRDKKVVGIISAHDMLKIVRDIYSGASKLAA